MVEEDKDEKAEEVVEEGIEIEGVVEEEENVPLHA
jgi:hypothetical protein